jgi:hypothetical protein
MDGLKLWLELPHPPLAGALVHALWQLVVIRLLCGLLETARLVRSAEGRYRLWTAGLLLSAASPVLTLLWLSRGAVPDAGGMLSGLAVVTMAIAPYAPWITLAWLVSVGLSLIGACRASLRVRRLLRTALPLEASSPWPARLQDLAEQLGWTTPLRVLGTTAASWPQVIGRTVPVVLLPVSAMTGLEARAIETCLTWELARWRLHDGWLRRLQRVVELLFGVHPAVWSISRRLDAARDGLCAGHVARLLGAERASTERADRHVPVAPPARLEWSPLVLSVVVLGGLLVIADGPAWSEIVGWTGPLPQLGGNGNPAEEPTPVEIPRDPDQGRLDPTTRIEGVGAVVRGPKGEAIELVGMTPNTAHVNQGWRPDGTPLELAEEWPWHVIMHSGNVAAGHTPGQPYSGPPPDLDAYDFLWEFRGFPEEVGLRFDLPITSTSYSMLPWSDPYRIRMATRLRSTPPPEESPLRVYVTEPTWGPWVRIGPTGEWLTPLPEEAPYAVYYRTITPVKIAPNPLRQNALALEVRRHIPSNEPFQFEMRAELADGGSQSMHVNESWGWDHSRTESWGPFSSSKPLDIVAVAYRLRPYRQRFTIHRAAFLRGQNPGAITHEYVTLREPNHAPMPKTLPFELRFPVPAKSPTEPLRIGQRWFPLAGELIDSTGRPTITAPHLRMVDGRPQVLLWSSSEASFPTNSSTVVRAATVAPRSEEPSGRHELVIELYPHGAAELSRFIKRHPGEVVYVLIDGEIVGQSEVLEPKLTTFRIRGEVSRDVFDAWQQRLLMAQETYERP